MQRALALVAVIAASGCYASHEVGGGDGSHGGPIPGVPGSLRDVDGDGRADLLVAAMNPARVYVYGGTPSGLSPRPVTTIEAREYVGQLSFAGDLDHDGYTDVAIDSVDIDERQRHLEIFRGGHGGVATRPSAELTPPAGYTLPFPYTTGDHSVTSADVDGDGWVDLVVATTATDPRLGVPTSHAVAVYLGREGALPTEPTSFAVVAAPTSEPVPASRSVARLEQLGDVNADGREDIALLESEFEATKAYVFLGADGGVWADPIVLTARDSWGDVIGIGDPDGDGFDDVTVGSSLFRGARDGFAHPERFTVHAEVARLIDWRRAGDLDADGDDEVLAVEIDTEGVAYVGLHDGTPYGVDESFSALLVETYEIPPDVTGNVVIHAAGDVDADGRDDAIVAIPNMGELHLVRGGAAHDTWSQTIAAPPGHRGSYFGYLVD